MEQIGVHETKTNLSALLKRIALGEEFEITNRGKVVAKIVQPKSKKKQKAMRALKQLDELSATLSLGSFDELMAWRMLGRR